MKQYYKKIEGKSFMIGVVSTIVLLILINSIGHAVHYNEHRYNGFNRTNKEHRLQYTNRNEQSKQLPMAPVNRNTVPDDAKEDDTTEESNTIEEMTDFSSSVTSQKVQ